MGFTVQLQIDSEDFMKSIQFVDIKQHFTSEIEALVSDRTDSLIEKIMVLEDEVKKLRGENNG